jgi:signal transduction histidine kinase
VLILRDITKAKSLEEERDEFISVVSPELRTPITIAEGTISNVRLMAERSMTPPGTLERSLADAHEQILFLARMVNDLSTLSRAERGVADTPEQINIKEMLDSLYGEYAPEAKKKQLRFDLDTSGKLGTVTASHLYLRELLQNFITNAIKYTKEGSVTLRAERDGQTVRFEVSDTGIGISKSDQVKIFNKFYRSEDYRTRETGGTGLGLYVAFKLSKKLNTKIDVKSRLNHGSSFSFSLSADNDQSE